MSTETNLVKQETQVTSMATYFPTESDWKMMLDIGTKAFNSGMLPSGIKKPEAAAIIALKGRELGLSPMLAFAHIHVINGRPSMSAEMLQALARKNLPGLLINPIVSDGEKATIEFLRPEKGSRPLRSTFTMEDARRAELLGNPTWKKYPAAMLWSRAVTAGLRKICPEALMGVSYSPEELGANVGEDGNVIETTGKSVEEPARATKEDIAKLYAVAKAAGITSKEALLKGIQAKIAVSSVLELTSEECAEVIGEIEMETKVKTEEKVIPVITPVTPITPAPLPPSDFDAFDTGYENVK